MQIIKHTVATLEYTLTDDAGEVLDTTSGRGPLAYVHGTESIIPGLEKQLEGKAAGAAFKVRIEPAEAYGARHEDMVQTVARDQMPDGELEVGMQLQAQNEEGTFLVTVIDVAETEIKLDANHPLAGVPLNFDVKVVEVRAASEEEITHGHPHGPGGTITEGWSLYLVRTRAGELYTGIALDVERRLAEHRAGRGAKYLRGRGPLELAHRVPVGERGLALQLERRLKRLDRTAKEALVRTAPDLEALCALLGPGEPSA